MSDVTNVMNRTSVVHALAAQGWSCSGCVWLCMLGCGSDTHLCMVQMGLQNVCTE